ncbi:unnamed protein product [Cunninghamella blakesleeana]
MSLKLSPTPRQSIIKTRLTRKRNESATSTDDDHILKAPFLNTNNEKKVTGKRKGKSKATDINDKMIVSKDIKIHQEDLNDLDILLRSFDLNYKFGPCIGMSRLDRWERAQCLGLHPPECIKDILINKNNDYQQPFYYEAKVMII